MTNDDYIRRILNSALQTRADQVTDWQLFVALSCPALRGVSRDRACDIENEMFQHIFRETATTHGTELMWWILSPERGWADFRDALKRILDFLNN